MSQSVIGLWLDAKESSFSSSSTTLLKRFLRWFCSSAISTLWFSYVLRWPYHLIELSFPDLTASEWNLMVYPLKGRTSLRSPAALAAWCVPQCRNQVSYNQSHTNTSMIVCVHEHIWSRFTAQEAQRKVLQGYLELAGHHYHHHLSRLHCFQPLSNIRSRTNPDDLTWETAWIWWFWVSELLAGSIQLWSGLCCIPLMDQGEFVWEIFIQQYINCHTFCAWSNLNFVLIF